MWIALYYIEKTSRRCRAEHHPVQAQRLALDIVLLGTVTLLPGV